jgi:predicted SAM-dependent methyltransferase
MLLQGRPRCLSLIRGLVADKKGLEIGGPSAVFRNWYNLPIYDSIESLDNCDFSQSTTWANHTGSYNFSKHRPLGRTYFCEGADLQCVSENQYDFLLSSHNLEHLANPIKGLKEWQRVVKPGGHLIVVLPHHARTFDHRRTPTQVSHMIEDYERQTGEDDLTHVNEVFEAHRLNKQSGSDDDLYALLMNNFSHRMMHHHVFDESNSKGLLEAAGLKVLMVETQLPFHIYLVAELKRDLPPRAMVGGTEASTAKRGLVG